MVLSDALSKVVRLSKLLQAKKLDLTFLRAELQQCLDSLDANVTQLEHYKTIPKNGEEIGIQLTDNTEEKFLQSSGQPYMYIEALKKNITRRFEDTISILNASAIFDPKNLPVNPDQTQ